jgi:superfamily II DNA or RNA helicase
VSAAVAEEAPQSLYASPLGLFDFQADGVARTYWQWTQSDEPVMLALWDTGIGKSLLAMATCAWLVEDGLVDQVIVVAEANKVLDWAEDDFPTFTSLSVKRYAGEPKKREKMLADPPQVLVMSYETGRNDICSFRPRSRAITGDLMLSEALKGKRVAIVFDEFSRLRNRSSKLYLAWDHLLNRVLRRPGNPPYVLGLTATTVESSPENHWNAGRLLSPERAGSVAWFEDTYVATRSIHDNSPVTWRYLTPKDCPAHITPLNALFAPITMRKRKTDDDVIDHFPAKMENPPTTVKLSPRHRALYDQVEEVFADPSLDESVTRVGFGVMRQIAGHPMSLLSSNSAYAKAIVEQAGAAFLEEIGAAKVDAMLEWQERMAQQQTVIFTFYGGSILPRLEHRLRQEGYRVSVNHGALSAEERKRQQDAYKAGDTQIFLSSDAGAKGLNLGVGSGLLHYECPLLYSTFDQRSNRIHRIDSRHASVTIDHLLVPDTVEVPVAHLMLKRNQWAEAVQDPDLVEDYEPTERFLRHADRLAMLRRAA